MKTLLHPEPGEARTFRTLPLAVLAWLEATALKSELAPYLKRARDDDRWYVCRGEEAFGPVPFEKIMRLLLRGEGSLPVLHESEAALEPAPWRAIAYRSWPLGRFAANAWIVGFWAAVVALGFVIVSIATPIAARAVVGMLYLVAVTAFGVWRFFGARRGAAPALEEQEFSADSEPMAEPEAE